MEENEENNKTTYYQVKFVILGDIFVGKTNIYYRFVNGEFINNYQSTILIDFLYQKIKIEDKLFSLQLWDTAGNEKYKSIAKGYYTNAACCILVYDITKEESFRSINKWANDVKLYANNNIILFLVGNKYDLNEERKIEEDRGRELASQYNMEFLEVSAKTGYNIDKIFNIACQKIYENIKKGLYDENEEEGVKICKTYSDFAPNKTFSLMVENNNFTYNNYKKNEKNSSSKRKKKRKWC